MGQSILGVHVELPKISIRSRKRSQNFVKLINQYICYNQGKYIEYEYLLGLKHKDLKDELGKTDQNKENLIKRSHELLLFIKNELDTVTAQNFKFVLQYFEIVKKSSYSPRVCVKTLHNCKVADGFRNKRGAYVVPDHLADENTGFKKVVDSGIWHIENDIPTEAKNGAYFNPRLDDSRARRYIQPLSVKLNKEKVDRNWMACWSHNDDRTPASHESCYKSTMIIPMTLKRNAVSEEFIRRFFLNGLSKDRTIWGFLCFDHPVTGYFSKEIDRRVGYMFADILSLYYVSAFIHTQNSESFLKILEIIGNKPKEWRQLGW